MQATKTYPACTIHEDKVNASLVGLKKKEVKNGRIINKKNTSQSKVIPKDIAWNAEEEEAQMI